MENKICTDCNKEFLITDNELALYNKVQIELPTQCFICRIKQHFAFWNFGKFRKTTSDFSGTSLITVHPKDSRYPIYSSHEWWGDGWDPMVEGKDYDANRSFFDQLKVLQEKIPRPHQFGENSVNCDWCDDTWESKNSYLCRSILRCENLSYGYRTFDTKDSVDIVFSNNLQNSYDCLYCYNSYNLNFSEISRDCLDSFFLFDCRNCSNCFMCYNLRGKQYCILNEQYTKESYFEKLKEFDTGPYQSLLELKNFFEGIKQKKVVHRENFNIKVHDSIGNYLTNCNSCTRMFSWENSQNCFNSIRGFNTKDCIDLTGTWNVEVSGNNSCVTGGYSIKYSSWSDGRYSEYLDLCYDVEYCFGCVGLRKKKYCILNKQYTKEEYELLKGTIISDMKKRNEYGRFLPYSMSLSDYNLSTGYLYLPETKREDILAKGGYWNDDDNSSSDGISSLNISDNIINIDDSISIQALICPQTGYRYNIAPGELEFYKRKNIAIPRLHFDARLIKQIRKTTILDTYSNNCCFCGININAYYPPEWGYEKIACETCYQQNIN